MSSTFEHKGATFTAHPLTILQKDIARRIEFDLMESWLTAHDFTKENYPRMHDALWVTFVVYMLATDIEGKVDFITVNPALANGNLTSAYDSWCAVVLADRELQRLWDIAYRAANETQNDPQASSAVPSGDSKSETA